MNAPEPAPRSTTLPSDSSVAGRNLAGAEPPAVPDYELIRRIGGGSYGDVWLARSATGVLRALKIVHRSTFDDDRPFQREFEGIQRFERISREHPGQLALFHIGRNESAGYFYYVMELADAVKPRGEDGRLKIEDGKAPEPGTGHPPSSILHPQDFEPHTLRADLQQGRLPAARVLEIGLVLTEALAHLHTHGLVHRDVKPSNVIFVNGRPKLADIGLVTDAGDTRSIVGTEGYLPQDGPGTPQADIFALGKVLYEALTGLDRRQFPELPEEFHAWPDAKLAFELNEVILKACESDSRQRYQNAEPMRADLELLQHGQSVKRRRSWQRTLNHAKKLALALTALAVVASLVYRLSDWRTHPSASTRSGQLGFTWSTNAQANEEFRLGMGSLHGGHTRQNSLQAIQHLQRGVILDPNFADAWAQLAGAWNSAAGHTNQQANVLMAAEKAVSLDTNSALAYSMLASAKDQSLDWAGAEEARLRSIALAPNAEDILLRSALGLACTGRPEQALDCLEKARRADPTSGSDLRTIYSGYAYAWSGQYDRAIEIFNRFPDASFWMKQQHALVYLAKDDYPNAIRLQRQAALAAGGDAEKVKTEFDALEAAFKAGGKEAYWKLKLQFESPRTEDGEHWMRMAEIHARLNQPREAIEYLRQAKEKTPGEFAFIYTNPSLISLREEPKFRELIAELWLKK